jgi:hypothetical protein
MRLLTYSDLDQVYSQIQSAKPNQFWAITVSRDDGRDEAVHGIPHNVLNKAQELSNFWCGWGFGMINGDRAFLLFENKEDAIFAKIHIGENVNYDY